MELPHRIDPVVCLSTAAIYLLCSFVLSPLLVNSSSTTRKYLRRNTRHQLLGQFVYSVVTSCLTVHIIVSGNMVRNAKSSLGFLTVEISFCYFVTEIVTTLMFFHNTITGEKMHFLHQITGSVGLLVGLHSQGTSLALCILRLFSRLSTTFLTIRLWLQGSGMKETGVYLANFTAMIVAFFVSHIVIIPWYWRLYVYWVSVQESSLLLYVIFGFVSGVIDTLNIYWFYCMTLRFVDNVKMMRERSHVQVAI